MAGIIDAYETRLADGKIEPDAAQLEVIQRLDDLENRLENRGKKGWFSKPARVEGLYIWGGVGRGKSMLMDLFFETVDVETKRRVHFHDFMQETHAFINQWKKMSASERKSTGWGKNDDPIPPAATKIAEEAELLCFDEFQVTDIADAVLLGRLFEHLLEKHIVVVATSNRHPDELYKNGLNRQRFVPFIHLLKETHYIHEIRSERDYRLARLTAAPIYYSPLGPSTDQSMQEAWQRLTSAAIPKQASISVQGRTVLVAKSAGGVAWISFSDWCEAALGPADYLAFARTFDTVLISDIPILGPDNRNAARRLVTLIDALYEAKTKVVISADAEPDALYVSGDGAFEFERTAS